MDSGSSALLIIGSGFESEARKIGRPDSHLTGLADIELVSTDLEPSLCCPARMLKSGPRLAPETRQPWREIKRLRHECIPAGSQTGWLFEGQNVQAYGPTRSEGLHHRL